jgi:N-methylhydantoinase A
MSTGKARVAVDIGGTFTDFVLEAGGRQHTHKVPTTPRAPERAVLDGLPALLAQAGIAAADVGTVIHGTTLATNAIIERKGARTAMLVTRGFRDAVEMAFENRFEQYDVFLDKPAPLVPRELRLEVPERLDARGKVLVPLDEAAVALHAASLAATGVEALAVCFMHAYLDARHERRAREIVVQAAPGIAVSLSAEVSPEMREYERWSTTVANAYVQPVISGYLGRLEAGLRASGFACPLFLVTSGGGLTTVETARRLPVRLVESGPAGGAILAAQVARDCSLERVLSFDMGGTTAKICLIDGGEPAHSRTFEVARQYRFLKGSGLPLRIPVIEMVEIGAGGGSIAAVDALGRLAVGPGSAGAEPGPACYGRGGEAATVTDADVALGRVDPARFAGGTIALAPDRAQDALGRRVAAPLGLDAAQAALAVSEVVEENMANAARVHAVERGKELAGRTLIAFGGAAPLHAARLAAKLGIDRVLVPMSAGVGSAVGFLAAPVAYEVARSRYTRLDATFDAPAVNALFAAMRAEAEAVVRAGAPGAPLLETRSAEMRYTGQGHEITVSLAPAELDARAVEDLLRRHAAAYRETFGLTLGDLGVEVMNWTLRLAAAAEDGVRAAPPAPPERLAADGATREVLDAAALRGVRYAVHLRADLRPGNLVRGPALVAEPETTTLVPADRVARVDSFGHLILSPA